MEKNFLVHALYGNSPDDSLIEELLNIWEVVYLLKAQNEIEAQESFMTFLSDDDLSSGADGSSIPPSFLGIRFISECPDDEFVWQYEYDSVVELSYIEYEIKIDDLELLKSAQRVPVVLTRIRRRICQNKSSDDQKGF